jgi:hypothetical protein
MFRNVFFLLFTLLVLIATSMAENTASPPANLTINEIVEKNAIARGGLSAWRSIQSMKMSGEMDAGKGIRLPFQMELKRSHKMRLELQIKGDTAVQVFDGKQGWKLRPFLGRSTVEKMSPEELRSAAAETELDGALMDYMAKGYQLELVGVEQVEEKDAYKLKLTLPGNLVRHVWVDAASLLEVKIDGSRKMDGKDRTMETYLRDYKLHNGLLVPHLLETVTEGVKGSQKLVVDSVVLNPPLADERFSKP